MNTLNQILQNLYVYNGNKDSVYMKDNNGYWFICHSGTKGFVKIEDVDGQRKKILDNKAIQSVIYIYKDKQAFYLTNTSGEWFICTDIEAGFVKIVDLEGERTKNLNQDAAKYDFIKQVFKEKKIEGKNL